MNIEVAKLIITTLLFTFKVKNYLQIEWITRFYIFQPPTFMNSDKKQALRLINDINNNLKYEPSRLDFILKHFEKDVIYFKTNLKPTILLNFLYWNCHRFNRFSIPSPYVLEDGSYAYFKRFLSILKMVESDNINTACLEVDKINWDIFNIALNNTIQPVHDDSLNKLFLSLNNLTPPKNQEKFKEFQEHKDKANQFYIGYINSGLKTKIKTTIPVSPVKKKTKIRTNYEGKDIIIVLTPLFYKNSQSLVETQVDQILIPLSKSQWQNIICEVEIEIDGIIDPIQPTPSLSILHNLELPSKNWPYVFTFTFHLIEKISWQLYQPIDQIGKWLASPNDISSLEFSFFDGDKIIYFILKDPPSHVFLLTTMDQSCKEIDLTIEEYPWYSKCLLYAKDYLAEGNTNEAILWLNIGIEALFETISSELCSANGIEFNELNSGKAYWKNARELVEKFAPECSPKIKWPEQINGNPSWYTKIKFLADKVKLKTPTKEILKQYNIIQKNRNALFHGSSQVRANAISVEEAIDAYQWMIENFQQAD